MKRILSLLLTALLLAVSMPAMAATSSVDLYLSSFNTNVNSDHIAVKYDGDKVWTLIDAQGNALTTAPYTSMFSERECAIWKVEAACEDGMHGHGLIDDQGREIVPPIYAATDCISEKWQAGMKCVEGTEEDYDIHFIFFGSADDKYMKIETVDFYYDGSLVGSLPREQYANGYCTARGDYLCVRDRDGGYHFYNSKMEPSPWAASSSDEFVTSNVDGRGVVVHQGTGQIAFAPDCTLTNAEVESPYWYIHGAIVDLQGNTVCRPAEEYEDIRYCYGGYAVVYKYADTSLYGMIDMQGNVVVPCQYNSIWEESVYSMAHYGSVVVEDKNHMLGIIDSQGNVLVDFTIPNESGTYSRGNWISINNEDGTVTVVTPAGELPEHYKEARVLNTRGSALLDVVRTDGTEGIINMQGEEVIPFSESNRSMGMNSAGTMIIVRSGDKLHTVYTFDRPSAAAALQPADDGSWTCPNGHSGQTGKFCSECGSPRPEA